MEWKWVDGPSFGFIRLTTPSGQRLLLPLHRIVAFESRRADEQAKTTVKVEGADSVLAYAVSEDIDAIEKELMGCKRY